MSLDQQTLDEILQNVRLFDYGRVLSPRETFNLTMRDLKENPSLRVLIRNSRGYLQSLPIDITDDSVSYSLTTIYGDYTMGASIKYKPSELISDFLGVVDFHLHGPP